MAKLKKRKIEEKKDIYGRKQSLAPNWRLAVQRERSLCSPPLTVGAKCSFVKHPFPSILAICFPPCLELSFFSVFSSVYDCASERHTRKKGEKMLQVGLLAVFSFLFPFCRTFFFIQKAHQLRYRCGSSSCFTYDPKVPVLSICSYSVRHPGRQVEE